MALDLVLSDCRLVTPSSIVSCDIGVNDGTIAVLTNVTGSLAGETTIDVAGRYVLPGCLDTHVHLGNGEQDLRDDCATESRHAVSGGVTTLFAYIVNTGSYLTELSAMATAVNEYSLADIYIHPIVVNERQVAEIPKVAERFGVCTLKTFMAYKGSETSPSGISGLDDGTIYAAFSALAELDHAVAMVHSENMDIIRRHQTTFKEAGRQDTQAWSDSRPEFGELEAIGRMIELSRPTGVQLLIPHMGIGHGSELLKGRDADRVFLETCPHYLVFDKTDDRGVDGKVNPPLRDADQIAALWDRLKDGTIDVIGSDHCPFIRAIKGEDLWTARPGIPGGSAMILPVLLKEGFHRGRLSLPEIVRLTSTNAARIFGLYPRKGTLQVGSDADLAVVDVDRRETVTLDSLHTVSDFSPYVGWEQHGTVDITVARGQIVHAEGDIQDVRAAGQAINVNI